MNCKQCQEKIMESLAAGEDVLAPEVATHQNSCVVCGEFYVAQRNLFQAVDTELQSLVNRPVPPALLPAVRARLDEMPVPRRAWSASWSFAALAVVAIMAVSIGHSLRRPGSHPNSPKATSSASPSVSNPQTAVHPPREWRNSFPKPKVKRVGPAVSSTAAPEVIVLEEERQAFAKFVAELPEQRGVALTMTRPALEADKDSLEIALLRVESLELKSLEGTPGE